MPERGTLCPGMLRDVCAYSREEVNVWSGIDTVAELFDLPADLVAGLPHLEMMGSRQLYLEHHTGILAYSDEQIDVNTTGGVLRVRGARLALMAMTAEELRIGGDIAAVEWVR